MPPINLSQPRHVLPRWESRSKNKLSGFPGRTGVKAEGKPSWALVPGDVRAREERGPRQTRKITIDRVMLRHIHAFLVNPPVGPPKSQAPRAGGGVPLGGAGETETPRSPSRWRGGGGSQHPPTPAPRGWKCFLRNACLVITEPLSYRLGKHGPKVGKHHEPDSSFCSVPRRSEPGYAK